jgi:Rho GTPase-activating protein RGD1
MSDRDGPRSVDHSTSWEHTSSWHTNGGAFSDIDHSPSGRRTGLPLDGMQSLSISSSGSPQRASFDSAARPSMSRWRDSIQVEAERRGMSPTTMDTPTLIEPTFDENVLRALCDLDVRSAPIA